ncbi:TorF family putative porin [Asticcacaulis benevestitus]|uniref:Porin domain-containing protein n=1 Tax=Asticcacaulis benevestitus DSM 16100 = ATCC BAA-896 TaxID=1121022 RepID=V4Q8W5_9CAUL|nr:TorF family putative porin [Asticcacaulis benevestitus]ESQ94310.1 hypothetical protein ABENE_02055 [Asticcacaulis benevestitus DSM 16100 = ATCC BAA-896]
MKKTLLVAAVAISALFAGGAASAQEAGKLSYNLAVTSNYVWRGVTQTDDNAALQGGVDYKKGTFYAGVWGSNVDFPYGDGKASTEVDLYMGLTPSVGDFNFDFGAIAYTYPSSGGDTISELKAAVSHSMGKGAIGAAIYLDTETLEEPYYEVNASYPISDKWSVSGALGQYEAYGYTTKNIGVTYAINSTLGLDLRWADASKQPSTFAATLKAAF